MAKTTKKTYFSKTEQVKTLVTSISTETTKSLNHSKQIKIPSKSLFVKSKENASLKHQVCKKAVGSSKHSQDSQVRAYS